MGLHLRTKFQVSSIILTGFRQEMGVILPSLTSKQTPKEPTEIRVNGTEQFSLLSVFCLQCFALHCCFLFSFFPSDTYMTENTIKV